MDFTVDVDLICFKGKEHDNMEVLLSGKMMMMMMMMMMIEIYYFSPFSATRPPHLTSN